MPKGQREGPGGGVGGSGTGLDALIVTQERSSFHCPGVDMLSIARPDGHLLRLGAGWEETLGWSPTELTSRPMLEYVHPQDRAVTDAEMRRVSEGHPAIALENRWRCRDGSYRWLAWTARRLPDTGHIAAIARDITERKDRETLLQRGRGFLQLVQFVAVAANGGPTTLTHALQATLDEVCANTGWTVGHVLRVSDDGSDDLVSSGIWHVEDGVTVAAVRRRHEKTRFAPGVGVPGRVFATGRAEHIADIRVLSEHDEDLVRCGLIDDRGLRAVAGFPITVGTSVLGVLEFFSKMPFECDDLLLDVMVQVGTQVGRIVERSRYEQALRTARTDAEAARAEAETARAEAQRAQAEAETARAQAEDVSDAKTEFLSRMSHELRTPLNSVMGFAELLGRGSMPSHEKEYLAEIERGGSHLLELINDVLDVSRIEAGKLQFSIEAIAIDDVIADVLSLLRPLASARNVSLTVGGARAAGLYVRADQRRLRQVLMNLVANGIKYNRENGQVVVTAIEDREAVREAVRIEVTDTGTGIEAKDLSAIFVPFERLSSAREVEGTGLGLALSKHLTEGMGGVMEVQSIPGSGSTFVVILPASKPALAPTDDRSSAVYLTPSSSPGARTRVLYIDDNTSNVALMKSIFMLRPRVTLISTKLGNEAMRLAVEHSPSLILLDVQLPDVPGAEVLRRLKSDPKTAQIPVLMVSAEASTWQIDRLIAAGASGYITKPIAIAELLEMVDRATGAGGEGVELVGRLSDSVAETVELRS